MDWAKWVFDHRVKNPPAKIVVLLFDSAPRVPHSKDLTHLQRSGDKRKRGFVPLPPDTLFGDNIELPDWSRVTGSKHLLPRVWDYLIGAIKRLVCKERFYDKSVFLDKPLCPKLAPKFKNLSGDIELVWKATNATVEPHYPRHLYGEGDMKTRAWVVHIQKNTNFPIFLFFRRIWIILQFSATLPLKESDFWETRSGSTTGKSCQRRAPPQVCTKLSIS